jgi:hypothetical protein
MIPWSEGKDRLYSRHVLVFSFELTQNNSMVEAHMQFGQDICRCFSRLGQTWGASAEHGGLLPTVRAKWRIQPQRRLLVSNKPHGIRQAPITVSSA